MIRIDYASGTNKEVLYFIQNNFLAPPSRPLRLCGKKNINVRRP